jgi:dTDP-4-amino-4,6-dideoxygalactose transaminase
VSAAAPPAVETPVLPADPGAAYRVLAPEIDAAIHRVLRSGGYLLGSETRFFEAEFAGYHGVERCVTTASGTDALELALRALGIGAGDAVVTVSHTAVATVAAIDAAGALPVLVDVSPETFTMDPTGLRAALEADTGHAIRAVIPVHLYGHPAPLPEICRIAADFGISVIEDCAQAHGAALKGRLVGTWGAFGAFSFYPTKNLGALGDAGALITASAELAERVASLKQYGWRERYVSDVPGVNSRMDELQAAILRVKLPHLDADNAERRRLASLYDAGLAQTPLLLPFSSEGTEHVYHQYVVRSRNRERLRQGLQAARIGSGIHYPVPVHQQPGYCSRVEIGPLGLRHTETLCGEILSLPMHPHLSEETVHRVIREITRIEGAA